MYPPRGDEASGPRFSETGSMRRQVTDYLRVVLAIALAVGMVMWSNSSMVSHDGTELVKILAEYDAEIEKHGHAHEDIVDLMHAHHGHAHDVADHDHNIAFLQPRVSPGILLPTLTNWAVANNAMPDRRDFDLDRPPRV